MNLDRYQLETNPDYLDFEFSSIGPKGEIRKIVRFSKMNVADATLDIYNLAFGDYSLEKDRINDLIVSNNKDAQKVMATVAAAVVAFTDKNPHTLVFAQGSTPARTRYYMMGISANFDMIKKTFEVWGYLSEQWEQFQRNKPYTALLAKRK